MKKKLTIFLIVLFIAASSSCGLSIVRYQNNPAVNNSTSSTKPETDEQELWQTEVTEEENYDTDETVLPEDYPIPEFKMIAVPASYLKPEFIPEEIYGGYVSEGFITEAFELAETEVTYELWFSVKVWAKANGYIFQNEGCEGSSGKAGAKPTEAKLEPVTCVSWNDCIVWLNALSEMTGKTPVYINKDNDILRNADEVETKTLSSYNYNMIQAKTDGYRLPEDSEWTAAARYIDGTNWTYRDNASGSSETTENVKATEEVAVFNTVKTAKVATKKPNALGIYDMSGNVFEWCYDLDYEYGQQTDSCYMYTRGGSWSVSPDIQYFSLAVGNDNYSSEIAGEGFNDCGFRIARSLPLNNEHNEKELSQPEVTDSDN